MFKEMKTTILTAVTGLALLTGCGGNPINVAKERDRADEQRKDAEKTNERLEEENDYLKVLIRHVFATSNHIWVLAGALKDHEAADDLCANIDFELPTSIQFEEFQNEVYYRVEAWQNSKLESFHLADEPAEQKMDFGLALCRRAHDKLVMDLQD